MKRHFSLKLMSTSNKSDKLTWRKIIDAPPVVTLNRRERIINKMKFVTETKWGLIVALVWKRNKDALFRIKGG